MDQCTYCFGMPLIRYDDLWGTVEEDCPHCNGGFVRRTKKGRGLVHTPALSNEEALKLAIEAAESVAATWS